MNTKSPKFSPELRKRTVQMVWIIKASTLHNGRQSNRLLVKPDVQPRPYAIGFASTRLMTGVRGGIAQR